MRIRLRWMLVVFGVLSIAQSGFAAERRTENVVLITIDGLRWQEAFTGAEAALMSKDRGGVDEVELLRKDFWAETPEQRRRALMPFLWSTIAKEGQIWGNRKKGSQVRMTNGRNFSYPGYQEILTGFPDRSIDSNAKRLNPNQSVLEWLNGKPEFKGKVAAFCAWDVFPFILNEPRSGIRVMAGWNPIKGANLSERERVLNDLLTQTTRYWDGVTYDSFVFEAAAEHVRRHKPRVLYVAFGETDDWAHDGRYDLVLRAARGVDGYLRRLWEMMQSMPEYKDRTTMVITVDHGRGSKGDEWKSHSEKIKGSDATWLAVIGPDTPAGGERSNTPRVGSNQVAGTVAAFLGEDYVKAVPRAGAVIPGLMK